MARRGSAPTATEASAAAACNAMRSGHSTSPSVAAAFLEVNRGVARGYCEGEDARLLCAVVTLQVNGPGSNGERGLAIASAFEDDVSPLMR